MNSSTEVAKFKPEPTFEKDINEIKNDHLKSIAPAAMSLSAITSFGIFFEQLSMKNSIKVTKFESDQTFGKDINDIKDNYLKSISSSAMNISSITLLDNNLEQLSMKIRIEVEKFEPRPTFEKTIN